MSNKAKTKQALAEAITKVLWAQGLITDEERQKIDRHTEETLQKANC